VGLAGAACGLPPSVVAVDEGAVTFTVGPGGEGSSEIRVRVRSKADVAVESIRLRMVFAEQPIRQVREEQWRYRTVYIPPPLEPGEERDVTFTEARTSLYSRIEIVAVRPALRVALDGELGDFGVDPFVWEDTIFGPLGDIARGLGVQVTWHEGWGLAALMAEQHALALQAGSRYGALDGELIEFEYGVRFARGAIIGPVREVLNALGAEVDYREEENVLNIALPSLPAGDER